MSETGDSCACGCGTTVEPDNRGRSRRFVHGHNRRGMSAKATTADERFWPKVAVSTDGCWLWNGSINPGGYALFWEDSQVLKAHRWAYERFVGPIPEGLQLDHLCRVRHCVNPGHLEPVTQQENIRRGLSGSANKGKTHCPRGHPYSGDNLYSRPGGGRGCWACMRDHNRKRQVARNPREVTG